MVYVLNINGEPLMPTERHGKVKHLLKTGKAVVVKRSPFTIKLTYEVKNYIQKNNAWYRCRKIAMSNTKI
jgi:hypothetical protein